MPVKQDLALLMQERLKPHPRKFPPHRQFRVGPFLDQSERTNTTDPWEFCHTASPSLEYPRR